MKHCAYLSLGSNIDSEHNLPAAVARLARFGRVKAVSTVWETEPLGPPGQPPFLNVCVALETDLSAQALRSEAIAAIEAELGRRSSPDKYAPRPIDIDIMLFDRDVFVLGHRRIPDPEILERPFVAILLAEIAPDYVHPETGQTLAQIARKFAGQGAGLRRRDDVRLAIAAAGRQAATAGKARPAEIILLLAAAALRFYRLDFQPLWWDEGLSLFFARLDFWSIINSAVATVDVNPPVYRLLLGGWLWLVGWSDFTARCFSAFAGIILASLIYHIARRLGYERRAALAALFLTTFSPMLIYYSQEAKGYALVAVAGAVSVALWLRLHLGSPPRRWLWLLWSAAIFVAVGSHYMAAFLILTENLWTLALTLKAGGRPWRYWLNHWLWQLSAQGLAALGMLAFIIPTLNSTSAGIYGMAGGGEHVLYSLFSRHCVGLIMGPAAGRWSGGAAAAAFCALAAVGILWPVSPRPAAAGGRPAAAGRRLVITWLLIPWLGGLAFNLYRDFYTPRFILYSVPAFVLLAARGLILLLERLFERRLWVGVCAGVVGCLLLVFPTLFKFYTTPRFAEEDHRQLMAAMSSLAQADDAVLATYIWQEGYWAAYVPHLPLTFLYTTDLPVAQLPAVLAAHPRLWVLSYRTAIRDPYNPFTAWLLRHTALAAVIDGARSQAALFVDGGELPAEWPAQAGFRNGLVVEYVPVQAVVRRGEVFALDLRWRSAVRPAADYTVFVHVREPQAVPVAQNDGPPVNGLEPSTQWTAGRPIVDRRAVIIPRDAPVGTYPVFVGLYDPATYERVAVAAPRSEDTEDSVCVGYLTIID